MEKIKALFEDYRKQNPFDGNPIALYEPANYIMGLGGKRFRPILTILAYQMFRSDWERVLPIAYALEIFHNFSLVHDDIMDEAPLRRGKPTIHTKWDVNTGILSGDVMLIMSYEYLTRFDGEDKIPRLTRVFNRVAREVCEGQQMDINFESRSDVSIPEYIRMIELKTSVLLATCLEMGAIASGVNDEAVEHCYQVGRNIGIAFQLQDDLLDAFGTEEKIGKRVGGDIIQNKKTFLILKALELANEDQKAALMNMMASKELDPDQKVKEVKAILEALKIPHFANEKKNEFREKAFRHLHALNLEQETILPIKALMENLVKRDH